ncbi:MAG: class I tRNA ligase family protein, partial [Lachnospiraceae bacterium]|nr:class I tRNA ligase family protein [Lachnospiraceae bacterium]
IAEVDADLENYRITEAARALSDFTDELSNWYVRRCRERYWAKGMEQDKINAYMTLFEVLYKVCLLSAPMIPFMTEAIYRNIVVSVDPNAPESIHLCDYPKADETMINKELEESMDHVLKLVVMGRACRNSAAIKNRQPLKTMFVKAPFTLGEYYDDIIREELNVKEVIFTDDVRSFTSYEFKPQLRTLGPRYGKLLGKIRETLKNLDGNAAMDELKENGVLKFELDGTAVELSEEDLLIEMTQKTGYVSENNGETTVVLDTNLTEELIDEGFVREIISKIQQMRKEADFNVTDHIRISYKGSDKISAVFETYKDDIMGDTLGEEVTADKLTGFSRSWDINGESCDIALEVI